MKFEEYRLRHNTGIHGGLGAKFSHFRSSEIAFEKET